MPVPDNNLIHQLELGCRCRGRVWPQPEGRTAPGSRGASEDSQQTGRVAEPDSAA